jgi:hypothetical protein
MPKTALYAKDKSDNEKITLGNLEKRQCICYFGVGGGGGGGCFFFKKPFKAEKKNIFCPKTKKKF